jgi:gliding motility-associated-like protein
MKHMFTFIFTVFAMIAYTQYCPALGPDQILPCGVNTATLTADLSQCGPGSNPYGTSVYNVSQIPYTAQTNTGTLVALGDDVQSNTFNIGFTFCFYGSIYTQFRIGSNGWVSLGAGVQPGTFTSIPIPTANAAVPKNCIMGPWQDWNPGIGGQVRYQVQGTAPCRKLVVSWIGVPMYSCTNLQGTFHIVLYESTNVIETYIANKPNCPQWAGGTAVHGIHNLTGALAVTVAGRNSSQWTAVNDARRWTPAGAPIQPTLVWYQVGNPVPIAQAVNQITVTPPVGGAYYTCHLEYGPCNAGWSACNAGVGLGPDTVQVVPGPPNLPNPTIVTTNPICQGSCDGTIVVTPNGGSGVQTILWTGGANGFNATNLCAGLYNFTITDANGCTVSGNATLIDPPVPAIGPITFSDTACHQSANEIYDVPAQAGYTYQWSSIGTIINGQGTNMINVDWSTISSGFIPGAIQVTGYDANGCPSLPLVADITIFNMYPVLDPIGPFCSYDASVTLQGTPPGGVYIGNGVNGNTFTPLNAIGTNALTYVYTQSGCSFDTTISVTVNPQPTLDSISPYNQFIQICEGDTMSTLFTTIANLPGYNEWTFLGNTLQQDNLTVTWDTPGMFNISVVHWSNGCVSNPQQTTVTVSRCPQLLYYVPNTFTPDGNQYNQVWQPMFTSGFDPYDFQLVIFNRWGETIWESYSPVAAWDGTYYGRMCSEGVYTYKIWFGDKDTDAKYTVIGHLTLIR